MQNDSETSDLPVYKQLALGWEIAKQFSGLSQGNNKNYRLKKSGVLCNNSEIAVKSTIHRNTVVSKVSLQKF